MNDGWWRCISLLAVFVVLEISNPFPKRVALETKTNQETIVFG